MNYDQFEAFLLSLCVWREARGEGELAMLAIAFVVLQRAAHHKWWGSSISEVIVKPFQFSSMTAPGDPQLGKYPRRDDKSFDLAMKAAQDAIYGASANPFPGADHYYDTSLPSPPKWASLETEVGRLGKLVFHRLDAETA